MGVCAYRACSDDPVYYLAVRAFVGAPGAVRGRRVRRGERDAGRLARAATTRLPGRDGGYVVSQGREVGFDARLQLHVDAAGEVWSGGHVRSSRAAARSTGEASPRRASRGRGDVGSGRLYLQRDRHRGQHLRDRAVGLRRFGVLREFLMRKPGRLAAHGEPDPA